MPFGLCNASATFERSMEKVLHKVLHKICLVYLDDVIIFSKTFTGMLENLREVFLRLREEISKLTPKNVLYLIKSYLDHILKKELRILKRLRELASSQKQETGAEFLRVLFLLFRKLNSCLN